MNEPYPRRVPRIREDAETSRSLLSRRVLKLRVDKAAGRSMRAAAARVRGTHAGLPNGHSDDRTNARDAYVASDAGTSCPTNTTSKQQDRCRQPAALRSGARRDDEHSG